MRKTELIDIAMNMKSSHMKVEN